MVTAETKIFSVAVQQGKSESSSSRNFALKDVEGQMIDRPVILSKQSLGDLNSDDEFKPAQREVDVDQDIAEVVEENVEKVEKIEDNPESIVETKKSKKNKKKNKGSASESIACSSADEGKEVEVRPKKKKNKKEKTPEPEEVPEKVEHVVDAPVKNEAEEIFEEFVKEEITYPDDFSPDKDLVEFSEEEKIVEIEDKDDDSEKVEFFIREKSSSVESDDLQSSSMIDPSAAKPNPWFNKFLQKSSSLIEDQIFGAVKKYEDENEDNNDDEDMLELEKNQSNAETNIASLLEDDDNQEDKMTSSLPQMLKVEPKPDLYSSDDDLQFKPVPTKRNKKKNKQKNVEDSQDSCAADSESERMSELDDTRSKSSKSKGSKDGKKFDLVLVGNSYIFLIWTRLEF